jgi:hypothetical protein
MAYHYGFGQFDCIPKAKTGLGFLFRITYIAYRRAFCQLDFIPCG